MWAIAEGRSIENRVELPMDFINDQQRFHKGLDQDSGGRATGTSK